MAVKSQVAWALTQVTPYSAKVAIANVASKAVLLDDPEVSTGAPIIYGPIVERYETIEMSDKRDFAVKQFGENKLELSGDQIRWVNTRDAAKRVMEWIMDANSSAPDVHTMTVFGNPFVQPGDVVEIYYPAKNLDYGNNYIVRSVDNSFSSGLTTNVKVVRVL